MFTAIKHGMGQRVDFMEINKMQLHDVTDVYQLECECFSVPWSENSIKEELSNTLAHFFVAKQGDKTIGYIGTHLVLDECSITNLAVTKGRRESGVGSRLLKVAIENAKQADASFITLEVRESNAIAILLYKKHGFETKGIRKNFYEQPLEDGLIMTKSFKGEELT